MISVPARVRGEIATELRLVREEAVARVSEVDLLVAALRDHIRDLQSERDWLRAELARMQATSDFAGARWLQRGQRGQRSSA